MNRHWLSFCDDDKPKGQQFLGVAIVRGRDFLIAVERAHMLGINPGGQVMGMPIPDEVAPDIVDRMLSRREVIALGGRRDEDPDAYDGAINEYGTVLCEKCHQTQCDC